MSNAPEQAMATGRRDPVFQVTTAAFYIDADNQSSQCVKALTTLVSGDLEMRIISAAIAGNNHGQEIEAWRQGLVSEVPDIKLRLLDVCSRKQAADIALMMELGTNLERHIRERERVVIVSRDDLLIGAAEYAKSRGCITFVAYAASEIPTARSTR